MKKKIICIMGETASGKDSIAKYISKNFGINQVVSYTTRPKRDSEEDGREHFFISKEEMADIKKNQHMFAYTCIQDKTKTDVDGYEYCTTIEQLKDDVFIYVIDPNGVNYMKTDPEIMKNLELLVLYIYVPYEVRRERAQKSRSDFDKFETRCKQEEAQFREMVKDKNFDYIIENLDLDQACLKAGAVVSDFVK